MSPRPYRGDKRRAAVEDTRSRIIDAARQQIADDVGALSIEGVAARAGVARMTVYYQFGSKSGLLEEVFNDLGARYFRAELPAITEREPLEALDAFIDIFFRFWFAERLVVRRIRGTGALDPDFEGALQGRDERRRMFLRMILTRVAENSGAPSGAAFDETLDVLDMLTTFQTYDSLATEARDIEGTIALVRHLARLVLGVDDARSTTP